MIEDGIVVLIAFVATGVICILIPLVGKLRRRHKFPPPEPRPESPPVFWQYPDKVGTGNPLPPIPAPTRRLQVTTAQVQTLRKISLYASRSGYSSDEIATMVEKQISIWRKEATDYATICKAERDYQAGKTRSNKEFERALAEVESKLYLTRASGGPLIATGPMKEAPADVSLSGINWARGRQARAWGSKPRSK